MAALSVYKFGKRIGLALGFTCGMVGLHLLLDPLTAFQAAQVMFVLILSTLVLMWPHVHRRVQAWLEKPHELVGPPKKPQIRRWYLIKTKRLQVVLHHHLRSDPPVMHDHSWRNVTIVLKGGGIEWRPASPEMQELTRRAMGESLPPNINLRFEYTAEGDGLHPGRIILRKPTDLHWYQLESGNELWTLFITGREVREWGHVIDGKWRAWWKCENLDSKRID